MLVDDVLAAFCLFRGEEAVLARVECGVAVGPGATTFSGVVCVVEVDEILKRLMRGVCELREIGTDVVVEVYFDDGIFGFVGAAALGAQVPVPA